MTTDNKQRLLTGDEIRAAVRAADNMRGPSDATQPGEYVWAGAQAVLSKLRGAGEPAFYGFLDEKAMRVEVCLTPESPRADGKYAAAYYAATQASADAKTVEDLKKLFRQERDRAANARNAALEEAAKVCEENFSDGAMSCADKIRALKSAPAAEGKREVGHG